jgi:hypothetical protein
MISAPLPALQREFSSPDSNVSKVEAESLCQPSDHNGRGRFLPNRYAGSNGCVMKTSTRLTGLTRLLAHVGAAYARTSGTPELVPAPRKR